MSDNTEKVLKKVQKILAKTNNNNSSAECETALLMAQRILAENGLTMQDVNTNTDTEMEIVITDDGQRGKTPWWHKTLAAVIAKNFKCKAMFTHGGGVGIMRFMGYKEDAELALLVYGYAKKQIAYHAKEYIDGLKQRYTGKLYPIKNSYIQGYIKGIHHKFKEQVKNNEWGLVVVCDPEVEEAFMQKVKGSVKQTKARMSQMDVVFDDGFAEGNKFEPVTGEIGS